MFILLTFLVGVTHVDMWRGSKKKKMHAVCSHLNASHQQICTLICQLRDKKLLALSGSAASAAASFHSGLIKILGTVGAQFGLALPDILRAVKCVRLLGC